MDASKQQTAQNKEQQKEKILTTAEKNKKPRERLNKGTTAELAQ